MRLRAASRERGRVAGLLLLVALQAGCASGTDERPHPDSPGSDGPPSLVVLFADDLGYGDLSSYGHPTIRTPHLDRMAREGIRLTSFYAAAPVCTPSRAGLLTGRYPIRSGLTRVLFPASDTGLPASETTLAEALQARGYRTMAIGKWHLGHQPEFLPTAHGFDGYFGVPYSNDMDEPKRNEPPVPLMRDTRVVEQPVDQTTLTRRYTEEAIRFMRESEGEPFFVYLAYTMPHVPIYASEEFRGRSRAGLYGDVVEEMDWSVGQILRTLAELGLDGNTLVLFTSDNGPWLTFGQRHRELYGSRAWHGGSAGPLRGAKQSTYEGGVRVPAIARWPGVITAGSESAEPASALDLYPTLIRMAGGEPPLDRPIDGRDILPLLTGRAPGPERELFYFRDDAVEAVRDGRWKLRVSRHLRPGERSGQPLAPELFDLEEDPGERFDRAGEHPEVVERLRARLEAFAREVGARVPG